MGVGIVAASGVFLAAGAVGLYGTFVPQSSLWCRNTWHGPRAGDRVALTFDDGPSPGYTDRVLEILARQRVPASFFVIGRNVEKSPNLLRRVHDAGHLVGNHTFDHHHFAVFRGYRYWLDQLERTSNIVERTIGQRPRYFRPPVGIKFIFTAMAARRLGQTVVTWSQSARDGVATSVDRIMARLANVTGGDIITLHDGIDPHSPRRPEITLEALPILIEQLRTRGLEFARLDELIADQVAAGDART